MLKKQDIVFDSRLYSYSYFPQQVLLDQLEIPITYYSLPFAGLDHDIRDSKKEVMRWLRHLGNGSKMGTFVEQYVDWIWKDVESTINTYSSLNIHIMGRIPALNIHSKRLMRHNHPPRMGRDNHYVVTYVTPICVEEGAEQYFAYADYNDINYVIPSHDTVFEKGMSFEEQCRKFAEMYASQSYQFEGLRWQRKTLPTEWETLKIKFCGSRYVHSVENLNKNVHMAVVFNDVDYTSPLNKEGMYFEAIRNPDFL
ncbi:hypothetical protein EBT25_01010 [bacterium]|nr:hypothetical protein [bacterium]